MLAELDYRGKTTPELFERINCGWHDPSRLGNALGRSEKESAQELRPCFTAKFAPMAIFDS